MTLSAHLVVGAALAKMVAPEQPLLALAVLFLWLTLLE
jgi:hypothetical protein